MEQHAEVLRGGVWHRRLPGWRDLAATLLVLALLILLGIGARQMVAPFVPAHQPEISLSPLELPLYTLRTIMRMLMALVASLVFTFTYATLAGKSRRAETVLIPLLDVLQSVPILGYLSFTVLFFVALFPGKSWDRSSPPSSPSSPARPGTWRSASTSRCERFRPISTRRAAASALSAWQRFWRLEVPFAMPGLIWNMMMSMSGGWFFVVASEAISVGDLQSTLPGVGSYVALAIERARPCGGRLGDRGDDGRDPGLRSALFRPMVAWADKFRVEQTASAVVSRSWVLELFRRSGQVERVTEPIAAGLHWAARRRLVLPSPIRHATSGSLRGRIADVVWYGFVAAGIVYVALWQLLRHARSTLSWDDLADRRWRRGALTLLRVAVLIVLASVIWVPIGVAVGLRPRLTANVQPIAQFLAAFRQPLFPVAVFLILRFDSRRGSG